MTSLSNDTESVLNGRRSPRSELEELNCSTAKEVGSPG